LLVHYTYSFVLEQTMGDMSDRDLFSVKNLLGNPPAAVNTPAFQPVNAPVTPAGTTTPPATTTTTTTTEPAPVTIPTGTPDGTAAADNNTTILSNPNETALPGEAQDAAKSDKTPASPAGEPSPDATPGTVVPPVTPSGVVDPVFGSETAEQYRARIQSEIEANVKEQTQQQLLKQLGMDSMEELQTRLNPPAELTEEQKKRQADVYRAAVQDYSVREMGLSPDDFSRVDRYNTAADADLVFEHFNEKWQQNNKDNPLFAGKDLVKEARYEFDSLFHLNSENERLRQNGEESLKLSAAQIRDNAKQIITNAESGYKDYLQIKTEVGKFKNNIQRAIGQDLPKELTFDIGDNLTAKFQLDKIDKKALENYLRSDQNFELFLKEQGKDFQPFLKQKINEYIAINHYKDMIDTVSKTAHDAGVKKATPGAKAPFAGNPVQPVAVQPDELSDMDKQKIASLVTRR
jgi:hypothetical protein